MKYFIEDIQQTDSIPILNKNTFPATFFPSQNEHTHYTKPTF